MLLKNLNSSYHSKETYPIYIYTLNMVMQMKFLHSNPAKALNRQPEALQPQNEIPVLSRPKAPFRSGTVTSVGVRKPRFGFPEKAWLSCRILGIRVYF